MKIKEIYNMFASIGCLTFTTIDNGYPASRIAHLSCYDNEGFYIRTMYGKPWYHQLVTDKKIAVCGMSSDPTVSHDEDGMPLMNAGYTIRMTCDVREVPLDEMKAKSKPGNGFEMAVKDVARYNGMRNFVLYRGAGEIFDFDFEKEQRDHKLLRTAFSFNSFETEFRGMKINQEKCIGCGACHKKCSFDAINPAGDKYEIDWSKCDVCCDCHVVCPVDAIEIHNH